MPHFVVPAATPDAIVPAAVSPDAATAVASGSVSPSDAASATTAASTPATTSPTPSPTVSASATHQATAHATATDPIATAHASAASGGSGYWWLWLLLGLVILAVVGMAVFRFCYARSRRRTWYGLAMNAYDRGTALVDGLKSGQSRSEFTMYANDYDGVLRHLRERAPSEDARWTVARVSAALEAVRQAGRHPGAEIVRTSVADLETTLRGLRDSALGSAADAQLGHRCITAAPDT
jgi:hypothetical protein